MSDSTNPFAFDDPEADSPPNRRSESDPAGEPEARSGRGWEEREANSRGPRRHRDDE